MRYWYLALVLCVLPIAYAATINGVTICSTNYDCKLASDGVCPSNYQAGSTCATCDPDCVSCTAGVASFSTSANANPSGCGCVETACTDGSDNNGDVKFDYAGTNSPETHGDISCPVQITAAPILSSSNVYANSVIDVQCTIQPGVTSIRSVFAYIDNDKSGTWTSGDTDCGWNGGSGWSGNVATFKNCNVGAAGSKQVACGVYSSASEPNDRSYQTGPDTVASLTVNPTPCSSRTQSTNPVCENGDSLCQWCSSPGGCDNPAVSGVDRQYSSVAETGTCVAAGTCSGTYACTPNPVTKCSAQCSGSYQPDCAALGYPKIKPGWTLCDTNTCTLTSGCVETNCNDGSDNDNSGECDYDGVCSTVVHGDQDCPIKITAPPILSSSSVYFGDVIDVQCTINPGLTNKRSVFAYIDNDKSGTWTAGDTECGWNSPPDGWSGNVVTFHNCNVGTVGSKQVACSIYNGGGKQYDRSYQQGGDTVASLTVNPTPCSGRTQSTNPVCENGDSLCQWCSGVTCDANNQYSSNAGTCIDAAGTCQANTCTIGKCGATSDGTGFGSGVTCDTLGKGWGTLLPAPKCKTDYSQCYETRTPTFCKDGVDNDGDTLIDYADATPGWAQGQSCNVCDQTSCFALTTALGQGVNLPPWGLFNQNGNMVGSCNAGQPTYPADYNNPSITYMNATAQRLGDSSNLRMACGSSTDACWCPICAAGYSGSTCKSVTEASVPNGCNDGYDNDQNTLTDYNDSVCSSCTLSDVRQKNATAGAATGTNTPTNGAYYNLTGMIIPSNATPKVRYANSAGASPTKCYSLVCDPGYAYNLTSGRCDPIACKAIGFFGCTVNDDCGLYGVCGELCVASTCTAQPTISFLQSTTNAYVGNNVLFTATSSNPGITTGYSVGYGDGTPVFSSASPINNQPHSYASRGTYTVSANITWSGGVSPVQSGVVSASAVINAYNKLSGFGFAASPATCYSPCNAPFVQLTLNGDCDPGLACSYQVDTDGNNATYESQAMPPSAPPSSKSLGALAPGTYIYYAKLNDSQGSQLSGQAQVNVYSDPKPNMTWNGPAPTTWNVWGGGWANLNFTATDNAPGISISINYGNGPPLIYNSGPSISYTPITPDQTHFYVPGTYTAIITITDSIGQTNITPFGPFTITGLPCVGGTQAGNATYDNTSTECCTNTCNATKSGVWSCFAPSSCFPSNDTICDGSTNPPTWQSRAAGTTDQTRCQALSQSCSQYNWSSLQNECCGSTLYNASYTNPSGAGNTACCPQPNQCYTTAGALPDCYNESENTVALCQGGNDENCNGLIDGADTSCAAGGVSGTVDLYDASNNLIGPAVSAGVYMTGAVKKITDVNGQYAFNNPAELLPGDKTIYATLPGYTVDQQAFTLTTGINQTVNLNLKVRKCDRNCANDQGYCDTSCIGVGQCQPTTPELRTLQACQPPGALFGLKPGTEIILNQTNTSVEVGICCTIPGSWRNASQVNASENLVNNVKIDTLVKYTRLITLNGKTYKLVISTW